MYVRNRQVRKCCLLYLRRICPSLTQPVCLRRRAYYLPLRAATTCLRGEQRGQRGEELLLELPHEVRL